MDSRIKFVALNSKLEVHKILYVLNKLKIETLIFLDKFMFLQKKSVNWINYVRDV